MKLGFNSIVLAAASVFAVGAFAHFNQPAAKVCVSKKPAIGEQRIGYELIDLMRGEAWVTLDWTLKNYSDYSLGVASWNWIKNEPRIGYGARASILKSPGCRNNGEFTYQHMHGRPFFHIADITDFGFTHGEHNEIRGATVRKHHRLEFELGQTVTFLVSPDQNYFVRVNRPVGTDERAPKLPEAWSMQDFELKSAWQAELFGHVQVYRVQNGTSFQGPVSPPTVENSSKDLKSTQLGTRKS
ncbi:MAG: hypothetical protein AAFN43_10450 [Pseudomonadota bacterium]